MLDIIFAIIIGSAYYRLADQYGKSNWGYGILGGVLYFVATFVYGIIYGIVIVLNNPNVTDANSINTITLKTTAIVVGIVVPIIVYFILDRNWKKNQKEDRDSIDRIGKK